MTHITSTQLADGRELLYFDDAGSTRPRSVELTQDGRDLPPRGEPGEVRYDPLTGEWVAVAAHRQTRTHLPPADQCPICPTTEANPSEIPAPDYDVVVFENRFPSLGPAVGPVPAHPGWGTTGPAFGRCEVVTSTTQRRSSRSRHRQVRATPVRGWQRQTPNRSQPASRGTQAGTRASEPRHRAYRR